MQIALILAMLLLFVFSHGASHGEVYIRLDAASNEPLSLLLVPPKFAAGGEAVGEELRNQVDSYLGRTQYFKLLDPGAMLKDVSGESFRAEEIDFHHYQMLSAKVVVKGLGRVTGVYATGDIYAYDAVTGKELLKHSFGIGKENVRTEAKRFVSKLVQLLTGEPAVFDTSIAFISDRQGGKKELFVLDYDTLELQQKTNFRSLVMSPSWSPKGDRLAFLSWPVTSLSGRVRANWMPAKGGAISVLNFLPLNPEAPRWTPDGQGLLLTLTHEGDPEIYQTGLAPGGKLQRKTFSYGIDMAASYSPDGKAFAFTSSRYRGPQIFIQPSEGGPARQLSRDGDYFTAPCWSPRGDRVVYEGRTADGRINIFVARADGSGTQQQITVGAGNNENPSFAPDGQHLVFSSNRSGRYQLYTMLADGSQVLPLLGSRGNDMMPTWGPRRTASLSKTGKP